MGVEVRPRKSSSEMEQEDARVTVCGHRSKVKKCLRDIRKVFSHSWRKARPWPPLGKELKLWRVLSFQEASGESGFIQAKFVS